MRPFGTPQHLLAVVYSLERDARTVRLGMTMAAALGYVVDVVAVLPTGGGLADVHPHGPLGPSKLAERKRSLERSVAHFCAREAGPVEHRVWVTEQARLVRIIEVFEPSLVVATLPDTHADLAHGTTPVLWVPPPPLAEVEEPVTWRDWIPEGIPYLPHAV